MFVLTVVIIGQSLPSERLAAHDIDLTLVRLSDRALVPWPDGPPTLRTTAVAWSSPASLADALARNGINPDSHSYLLFYDLNPGIRRPSDIVVGTSVTLPLIVGNPALERMINDGSHIVRVTLDGAMHRRLEQSADRLRNASQHFLDARSAASALSGQVGELRTWITQIAEVDRNRRGPIMRGDSLEQLAAEADAATAIIGRARTAGGALPANDTRQLLAIHADLKLESERFTERLSNAVPVDDDHDCCIVNVTIAGVDKSELAGLRVYYTLNGLYQPPPPLPPGVRPFSQLGSGTMRLRAKNYQIWAARDGQPERPVTPALLTAVEETKSPQQVELRVRH
jgi:hypothetical protein